MEYAQCEECGRNLPTDDMSPTGIEDDGEEVQQLWICRDCADWQEPDAYDPEETIDQ